MKKIVLCSALLLSVLAVSAQTDKKVTENPPAGKAGKQATVRIKKVENINGVEKVTDTTYTVDDPSTLELGDGTNMQVINIDDKESDGNKKVVVVTDSQVITSDDESNAKVKIITAGDGMDEEIEKALKEAGVDPKNCNGTKKMVIVNEESGKGKDGNEEKRITKIVMVKLHITDSTPEDMKRVSGISKTDGKLEIEEMKMYPNPHDGKFNLNFSLKNKGDAKVSIFNVEGKEVYSEKLPNFTGEYNKDIDISSNKKGVYFVKIEQGAHSQVKKVVLE